MSITTELVASTHGVTLAVHDLGGTGPLLLLAHATGFHGRVWVPLAEVLADRFHSVALDFRGFGDSTPPADGVFDWHGFADDVLAVVDHLADRAGSAVTPLPAIGHSKGGAALLLAELARPGTFSRLFCFEPIVFPVPEETVDLPENHLAVVSRRRREVFASAQEAIDRYAAKPPLGSLRPDVLELYVRHGFATQPDGSIRLKADREHEARTYEMGGRHGGFDRLGEVRCPVLVAASGDGGGPATFAPMVAERLAHGELVTFPTLGHFGPLEDPVAVAEAAARFLMA